MMEIQKKFASLIIINQKGQFLMQERTGNNFHGDWGFFGGRMEVGETPEQAMEREIEEELGLTGLDYVKCFEDLSYEYKGHKDGQFYCFCHITDKQLSSDFTVHEGKGASYFYFDEMKDLNLIDSWEYQKNIFEKALDIYNAQQHEKNT